jgi:hypothetical protein
MIHEKNQKRKISPFNVEGEKKCQKMKTTENPRMVGFHNCASVMCTKGNPDIE